MNTTQLTTQEEVDYELDGKPTWESPLNNKEYKLFFCKCCNSWNIACDKCSGSSCNCTSCLKCHNDFEEFSKLKTGAINFLTQEEIKTLNRIEMFKKHIKTCLRNNKNPIDWVWLEKQGKLSKADYTRFEKELKEAGIS